MVQIEKEMVKTGTSNRAKYLVLFSILALAIALRVADLAVKGLWYDELISVTLSSMPPVELLKSVSVG